MSRVLTRFCAACGQPIVRRVPAGDTRERDVCEHCGAVHYVNPRPVVGTIPVWQDAVAREKPKADAALAALSDG